MSMNPITTTRKIEDEYNAYLESLMQVRNTEINHRAVEAIKAMEFVKGPYLELTPPFEAGATLSELVDSGIASPDLLEVCSSVHNENPLYLHQERAILKTVEQGRNIVVSTGTGSGKTECYLYPILDYLCKQKAAGTLGPGVRALLLFPMNALANDQVKRLRELLAEYPDITFGRYTGETIQKRDIAHRNYLEKYKKEPLPNELLSRDEMVAEPPHILLTNYAMLEYLLLRPRDSALFDGHNALSWKFIVLDEAHTYKGSSGTEIAYLLRRLKDRICDNQKGKLTCIATSATLGDPSRLNELAEFASNIFDEPFDKDDIILSQRIYKEADSSMEQIDASQYSDILTRIGDGMEEQEKERYAYRMLRQDRRIPMLHSILKERPRKLSDVAGEAFPELDSLTEQRQALTNLIELGAMARPDHNTGALLPARYHLFVKALEGMFVQLYPKIQVSLDRQKQNMINGKPVSVFELANCQHCNQEYLIGCEDDNGKLVHQTENEKASYYMLTDQGLENSQIDPDEDETAFEEAVSGRTEEMILCTACGMLTPANQKARETCCEINDAKKLIKVYKIVSKGETNTCAMCGSVSRGILKRFMTSNQAATFILADSIYQMIPPQRISLAPEIIEKQAFFEDDDEEYGTIEVNNDYLDESGRKLLVFSDNRQEAAYFAGYMDRKYSQNMWRRLILTALKKLEEDDIALDDLINRLVVNAEESGLFKNDKDVISRDHKKMVAGQYLFYEFLMMEKRYGLEGRTYVEFYPEPRNVAKGFWGLDSEHTWNLIRFIMDTFRVCSAVNYADSVDPQDEAFEPRNRSVYFRKEKSSTDYRGVIMGFLPAPGHANKRSRIIEKLLSAQGIPEEERKAQSAEILSKLYDLLVQLEGKGYLVSNQMGNQGTCYTLNYKKWKVRRIDDEDIVFRCERCGIVSPYTIAGFCMEAKCAGKHVEVKAKECRQDAFYHKLYENEKLIPMLIKEHTAQLKKDRAGEYQEEFEKGLLNILSCSTTFEMGVDVGQLEAILLRNVPPGTANYIQRAGRAGRRTSSAAFSVTFARRNSHDLNYYRAPETMISGKIKVPYIEIENDKIAERHAHSIVCSSFFKAHPQYFLDGAGTISGMHGLDDMAVAVRRMLENKPHNVLESMRNVFSDQMLDQLGIRDWSYPNRLADPDGAMSFNGALSKAVAARKELLHTLDDMLEESHRARKMDQNKQIFKMFSTYDKEDTIPFLASNSVLPKYGFPVDVVNLDIYHNSEIANGIDIARDLKMAIAEFAPGSSIVAGGKVWKSHSLNVIRDKGWPTYRYFECGACKAIAPPDQADEFAVLGVNHEEALTKQCSCGRQMKEKKFIIPKFGFSTCRKDEPKRVQETKPKKDYATKTQFWGVDRLDSYQEKERREDVIELGSYHIDATYSPNGKLVVLNRGSNGMGFFVCLVCGYAQPWPSNGERHLNKHGNECGNTMLYSASLGHKFNSDILRLEMPLIRLEQQMDWPGNQDASVLYAILDGASDILGIDRNDINGCLDHSGHGMVLVLFDEATGGAGHVKRIFNHLEEVLQAALRRVDGTCGCGPETSCYGCLRNYGNQMEHDDLVRGLAKEYLRRLLAMPSKARISSHILTDWPEDNEDDKEPVEKEVNLEIGTGWKSVLQLFNSENTQQSHAFAMELIRRGVELPPDEVGYELTSEEYGVLGYEAEMAWTKIKLALVLPEQNHESLLAFQEHGWTGYEMEATVLSQVVDQIKQYKESTYASI